MIEYHPNFYVLTGASGSANISLRTNEMGLSGPENPQLPRRFADAVRTPETGERCQSGL